MLSQHGIDIGSRLSGDDYELCRRRRIGWAARYVDGSGNTSPKSIAMDEIAVAHSKGIALLLVGERGGGTFDARTGTIEGQLFRADAIRCGYPLGFPLPTAIDRDIDPDPGVNPGLLDYFNAYYDALDGAYVAGAYGSYRVVKFIRENWRGVGFFWQTYAWSGGQIYQPADAFQYANGFVLREGLTVDLNIARGEIPWRIAA